MAGLCSNTVSPNNCGHRILTLNLDGVEHTVHITEAECLEPLSVDEVLQLLKLNTRRVCQRQAVTLAQLLNRVVAGDEATNVKQYNLIAPGSAITKTNIGTAYVDILPGANGQRSLVDFTGCTEFRLVLSANLIGVGPWGARVVRDGDNVVLFEAANLGAVGERELDSNWLPIPVAFTGLTLLRAQGKSQTAIDDPVFRRLVLLVR